MTTWDIEEIIQKHLDLPRRGPAEAHRREMIKAMAEEIMDLVDAAISWAIYEERAISWAIYEERSGEDL